MSDKEPLQIGGDRLECTKAKFDAFLKNRLITSCTLDNVGTFHFVCGEEVSGGGFTRPYLVYYNEKQGVLHTSHFLCYTVKHGSHPKCVAIDQNTFVFKNDGVDGDELHHYLVSLSDCWMMSSHHRFALGSESKLLRLIDAELLEPRLTEVHRTGLLRIRRASGGDVTLISNEGDWKKVHSTVLVGISSYFEALLKWNQSEETPNELTVDIPTSTLEVLVRYIYGEELQMAFVDACELIPFAQMSCLPELAHLALQWLKPHPPKDVFQAVFLWRKSFEARNCTMRALAAGYIVEFLPSCADDIEETWEMQPEEQFYLWKDVATATRRVIPIQ